MTVLSLRARIGTQLVASARGLLIRELLAGVPAWLYDVEEARAILLEWQAAGLVSLSSGTDRWSVRDARALRRSLLPRTRKESAARRPNVQVTA